MKLVDLKLERFGHFGDATLALGDGLTLLHGANEAGKSTLLAALRALLFGFPRGAAYDLRWAADTLAVGGTLALADGTTAELRREKKRGLRGKLGDEAATDELLRARLGRPSPELFSTVFAFGLDDLARGGEALRDEGLKAAMVGAGLGAARSPQAVIAELRVKAEALFTVKGRGGKLINAALGELKTLEKALRDTQVRGDDYQERVRARDEARAEAARLGAERAALLQRAGDKEALLRALPRRDELRGARAERQALSPPPLPPEAGADYERALADRAHARRRLDEIDGKLARAQHELEALTVDEALVLAAPRLRQQQLERGRHAAQARDADELAASVRTRRLELSRQLADLKPGWALDELDVLPHPLFTTGLERLRDGWSAQRERAQELGRLGAAARELEARRAALRRRLDPPWPLGSTAEFLPVPRAEEVKQHRAALAAAERAVAELKRDDERLRGEARELQSALSRLEAGGAVPSTEELARLRAARDAAVGELKRALGAAKQPAAAELAALVDAVETAVRAADAHADELRRRSDDVAKRAELGLRLGDVTRARADGAAALAAAVDERARAEAAWQALWARCELAPQSPETMLEWLDDYARLRDLEAERARLDERAAALKAQHDDYDRRQRAMLQTLGLAPDLDATSARRVVDVVLAVRSELEAVRADEERGRRLAAGVQTWRAEVKKLCAELAPDLAPLEAGQALALVDERLQAALKAEERRRHLSRDLDELAEERAACARAAAELEARLGAWRRRAGVDDDAAFLDAARAAARAHELDRRIEELLRAVAEARGAMAADAFAAALETAERSVVEAELGDVRAALDRVEAALGDANQRVGAAEATLAQLDGGARANELTMQLESKRAELRTCVEQYAVVTLARALLEKQVARFGERHQPRMIEELSALFAALTEGRYRRVYPRLDDDGTFVAVRADGVEVTPAQLSTGTREQLWLAVRLAYVRQYCDAAEPLPLVLDDVLVNFDAARARATLAVLAEFAKKTQVLLFTCHAHLVDCAAPLATIAAVPAAAA